MAEREYIGLDLGSAGVKLVRRYDDEFVCQTYDTFAFYRRFAIPAEGGFTLDLVALGLPPSAVVTACGYGRQAAALSGAKAISEIQAHAVGAAHQSDLEDFLLLDLGGQDSKIVRVKNGRAVDFSTNDKCAAGSGRYLSNMASILDIRLDELGSYTENPVNLSATCAVFGESELVGEIIKGVPLGELAAGINRSVVKRVLPLIMRHLPAPAILFSGGVAKNQAIHTMLEQELGQSVAILPQPQANGAIGCYYWGVEKG